MMTGGETLALAEGDAGLIAQADAALLRARRKVYGISRRPSLDLLDGLAQDLDEIAAGLNAARALVGQTLDEAQRQERSRLTPFERRAG